MKRKVTALGTKRYSLHHLHKILSIIFFLSFMEVSVHGAIWYTSAMYVPAVIGVKSVIRKHEAMLTRQVNKLADLYESKKTLIKEQKLLANKMNKLKLLQNQIGDQDNFVFEKTNKLHSIKNYVMLNTSKKQ